MEESQRKVEAAVEDIEPAEVFRMCSEAFNALPMEVQISVANSVTKLLKAAFAATLEKSRKEEHTKPLGLCLNMITSMLRCTDRAFVLRRSESCLRFHQKSVVLGAHGESKVEIGYKGALPGRGDSADHMAKTAMAVVNKMSQDMGSKAIKALSKKFQI